MDVSRNVDRPHREIVVRIRTGTAIQIGSCTKTAIDRSRQFSEQSNSQYTMTQDGLGCSTCASVSQIDGLDIFKRIAVIVQEPNIPYFWD